MVKRIAFVLVLLPAAEVVAFLLVVWAIGFLPALGLMLLASIAGAVVLSRAGRGGLAKTRNPTRANASGAPMLAIAGILLLLPGFITDLVGAGLLVRPIRRRIGAAIRRAFTIPDRPGEPRVVDLAPTEWRRVPERKRTGSKQP